MYSINATVNDWSEVAASVMSCSGVRFLTGAPVAGALEWRDEDLLNGYCSAVQRYIGHDHNSAATPGPTQPVARWRAISLNTKTFYESPAVQRKLPRTRQPAVPSTQDRRTRISESANDEDDHDFLEHSFAVHADLQSSQIAPQPENQHDFESTFVTESSIMSASIDESTNFSAEPSTIQPTQYSGPSAELEHRRFTGPVVNLEAIPGSEQLKRIQPQTMTVNLIVGIISIAPARTVRVRRGGYDMEIVEIVVGDETKAGFTVSSWHLPRESQSKYPDDLRKTLRTLRPQDVVLIERIALSSFNNQVYGQSLNRRATRNTTAITVLHKARESQRDGMKQVGLSPYIRSKIERVKEWASSFVGPGNKRMAMPEPSELQYQKASKRQKYPVVEEEFLPPDTQ